MEPLIIHDLDGFERMKGSNSNTRILLNLPFLDADESKKLEGKINRYYYDCGCKTGAFFAWAFILSATTYFIVTGFTVKMLIPAFIYLFLIALTGKLVGLVGAKYLLRKTINQIKTKLK